MLSPCWPATSGSGGYQIRPPPGRFCWADPFRDWRITRSPAGDVALSSRRIVDVQLPESNASLHHRLADFLFEGGVVQVEASFGYGVLHLAHPALGKRARLRCREISYGASLGVGC